MERGSSRNISNQNNSNQDINNEIHSTQTKIKQTQQNTVDGSRRALQALRTAELTGQENLNSLNSQSGIFMYNKKIN